MSVVVVLRQSRVRTVRPALYVAVGFIVVALVAAVVPQLLTGSSPLATEPSRSSRRLTEVARCAGSSVTACNAVGLLIVRCPSAPNPSGSRSPPLAPLEFDDNSVVEHRRIGAVCELVLRSCSRRGQQTGARPGTAACASARAPGPRRRSVARGNMVGARSGATGPESRARRGPSATSPQ